MNLKIIFWGAAILSLTACGNSEPSNEGAQSNQSEETVIELENNEEDSEHVNFNQNSKIDSEIYKEFFFTKELLPKNQMESGSVDDHQIAYGNQMPIGTDNFPVPYYMDYTLNTKEEKLDLALILTEGSIVKEVELAEDVFVHLEYDSADDALINVAQENASGEKVNHLDLTEEEWNEVAERSIEFVERIQSY